MSGRYFYEAMIAIIIKNTFVEAVKELYQLQVNCDDVLIQKTRKDFVGDYTINVFPFKKHSKKNIEQTASELGDYIKEKIEIISDYNIIKGFLNIVINDDYWLSFFSNHYTDTNFGFSKQKKGNPVVIEFSSPNTNKPLHLGHIRNNLLGWSISKILEANGQKVVKVNLVNDRGIHICKSMLAWERWGEGETPELAKMKGDKFVGKYYVKFNEVYNKEVADAVACGSIEENALKSASTIIDAQEMLLDWENGNKYTRKLWKKMNSWVYEGFEKTYNRLGITFDKTYYESDTYLDGKKIVNAALKKEVVYKKEDGSIWIDLKNEGLDEKLLLRGDGTSVYITQDLGTALLRQQKYKPQLMMYVVGNEQNYHFEVLKLVLKKMGFDFADNIHHLSYGMVELPFGKMKSREGNIVDADDLMDEMFRTAKSKTEESGKISGFSAREAGKLFNTLSLGALKYFILKVDPKKKILFNPEESIDFNGNTGPFIQYTHARIKSVLKKANRRASFDFSKSEFVVLPKEKEIIKLLADYPYVIKEAGDNFSPALIANYIYELAREYNQYYHDVPFLKADCKNLVEFRLQLSEFVGNVIKSAMELLGIDVPDRM